MATATGNLLLREARKDRGLSLRAAGAQIGLDWKTIQRLEAGKTHPRPKTGRLLADFYGLKPSGIWPVDAPEEAAI